MKINGEYPKFYIRAEGKHYAAISTNRNMCYVYNSESDCIDKCRFLFEENGDCESDLACTKNKVIYVEVQEKSTDD